MAEQIDLVIHRLISMKAELEQLLPAPASTIEAEAKAKICHYCKKPLNGEKPNRGDHGKCYKEIMRSIQDGEVTEEIAITNGWFAPAKKAGRKPKESPITQYSAELLAKQMAKKVADRKTTYRKDP